MKVTSNLLLTEKEIEKLGSSLDEVQLNLTLPNPDYNNIRRFGHSKFSYRYSKIPKELVFLRKISGTETYLLPRYYFSSEVKSEHIGRKLSDDVSFTGTLRDYQQEFIDSNKENFSGKKTGILLEAQAGSGKTVLGIYISLMLGRQTIVFVPTYYLAKQWLDRINQFTNAKAIIVSSKDTDIPTDSDFTIIPFDTFNVRELPKEFMDNVGCAVFDEMHRVGAKTYMPIIDTMEATYRIGLTATFRRTDNVHKILKYHFGEHLKMESRFPKPEIYAINTGVEISYIVSKNKPWEEYKNLLDYLHIKYTETKGAIAVAEQQNINRMEEVADRLVSTGELNKTQYRHLKAAINRSSKLSYPIIDSFLAQNSRRTKMIISLIHKCLNEGRTVLFLSKRKDVLKAMNKVFAEYNPMLIISETNSRTDEENDYLQHRCKLILGVTQLAKEGLDIDRLDTLIIHLPMKDTEQAVGRVARLYPKKKSPMVFYFLDKCPITYAVFNNAKKFMQINGELKGFTKVSQVEFLPNF